MIFLGPGGMWSRIRRSTLCRVHQFSSKSEPWEPLSSTPPPLFVLFGVLRTPFFVCVCVVWVCLFCVCVSATCFLKVLFLLLYIYIYTYLLLFLFLLAGRAAQRTNPRGPVPTPRGATPRGATKTPELRTPRPWRTLRRREPQGPRMRGPWTASTPWTQECPTTTTQRTSCRPSCPTSS